MIPPALLSFLIPVGNLFYHLFYMDLKGEKCGNGEFENKFAQRLRWRTTLHRRSTQIRGFTLKQPTFLSWLNATIMVQLSVLNNGINLTTKHQFHYSVKLKDMYFSQKFVDWIILTGAHFHSRVHLRNSGTLHYCETGISLPSVEVSNSPSSSCMSWPNLIDHLWKYQNVAGLLVYTDGSIENENLLYRTHIEDINHIVIKSSLGSKRLRRLKRHFWNPQWTDFE